jgi:hypothetical protein
VEFDDELLYLACLAHDVGLCNPQNTSRRCQRCFSIDSAHWAIDIAARTRWDNARKDRLAEAVILNLNGRVSSKRGTEAHFMMLGVLADVTGLYAWRISSADISRIVRDYPRLDEDHKLFPLFAKEANSNPSCRAHFAMRYLAFGFFMRHPSRKWE